MRDGFDESTVEQAALAWLEGVGWTRKNGAAIAPGEPEAERADFGQVVLERRRATRWAGSIPTCRAMRWRTPSAG
jgi:hypothetical protein